MMKTRNYGKSPPSLHVMAPDLEDNYFSQLCSISYF